MNFLISTPLVSLLGFAVGVVLYALLLAMTLRHPLRETRRVDFLLLATAVLGLVWNCGELFALVERDFGLFKSAPFLSAATHTALGFLPAVIVHLTWDGTEDGKNFLPRLLTATAYGLSSTAAALHFQSAFANNLAPSDFGLQLLTFGYIAILLTLFAFRLAIRRKAVLATALAVFAISALHMSEPHELEEGLWFVELIGHQSSLPLAFAILFQDFRFAFADLFLKRALSLLLLTLTAFGLYVFVAAPLVANPNLTQTQTIGITLGLWILTALVYPKLHQFAVWTVDKIILRRVNYEILREQIAAKIAKLDSDKMVLDAICEDLKIALTAGEANWIEVSRHDGNAHFPAVNFNANDADICVPTNETPFYHISLQKFAGGRRLLSDEIEMLEDTAFLAARRIDALRVSHERCEQEIREQEIGKLASEAELRALRAQINPHFLFNALTTIGYLIDAAPDKALATLMRLTQLLRGVLRASGEFSTLGDELNLIESYLEIERARFEERLQVSINVAPELLKLRVPALILQPLVENAVKHGISKKKNGGEVRISAKIENQNLILQVTDTGAGVDETTLTETRKRGVGLQNIEARLRSHFGDSAKLNIESRSGNGTTARIMLPNESKVQSLKSKV